jgi:hypothetical protein
MRQKGTFRGDRALERQSPSTGPAWARRQGLSKRARSLLGQVALVGPIDHRLRVHLPECYGEP